jgi:hypothetical protein
MIFIVEWDVFGRGIKRTPITILTDCGIDNS